METPQSRFRKRAAIALAGLALVGGSAWVARSIHKPNLLLGRSLLLVTIDTLRADHVGAYGYSRAATPTLDSLARRGARFADVTTAAPLTGPSHATILTGLAPPRHGVRENVTFLLDSRHLTLATRLKRAGYRTAAFVAAYPVAAAFGFGQGFDEFSEGLHPNPGIGQGAERPANEVADAAVAWLERTRDAKEPFFAWVHFYDPHAPYAPPSPFRETFAERPYDGEVAFADAQLGRILEALRAAGHERDTVVAVLADHGEGLGEHGETGHGILLYESTLRVPMLMAGPGVPEGRVISEPVGTIDVAPTLLQLLGREAADLPGRDLRPALEQKRLPAEGLYSEALFGRLNCRWSSLRSLREGEWKLVLGSEPELFELSSDPGETRNRADEERDRVERLRRTLGAAVASMVPGGDTARPVALSPEQEERLRSLGYAAGGGGGGSLDEPGLPDPRRLVGLYERLESLQSATGPLIAPAIREIATILEKDPGSPFAHFVMASVAYRGGQLELAEKAFARTLALDPDRPVIRQYYGQLLRDEGRLEDSERELRIAAEQAPAYDLVTRVNLAETLTARASYEEAQRILEAALAQEPAHEKARRAMGRLMLSLGRPRESLAYFEGAAEGGDIDSLLDLSSAYLSLPDPGRAAEAAAHVLDDNPGHPRALSLLGHALVVQGHRAEGLAFLERALAVGPRRAGVWEDLAAGFTAAGEVRIAERCRREAATRSSRPRPG
jgi:arylsulfatase A-like enzyme/tetratricopeptide (TPR) repeat protein